MPSEVSQTEKEIPQDVTSVRELKDKRKRKQTHRDKVVARGEGGGGLGEKGEGIRSTDWQLQKSRKDGKDSTGNRVSTIDCTGPGGHWKYRGGEDHFGKYECLTTRLDP